MALDFVLEISILATVALGTSLNNYSFVIHFREFLLRERCVCKPFRCAWRSPPRRIRTAFAPYPASNAATVP